MERSPLLSPLQTASRQLKSSRIHSTVSSPGGVQHLRSSSRSPPPPTKPRSESHDRSYSASRKHHDRSRSQERDERNRPRDFPNADRRRPPRNGSVTYSNRNGPDGSPPSDIGFQESPRQKYPERFPPRDARFRSSESLKNSPGMGDHPGQSSRHFSSSAPNTSTISHPQEFSPPSNYKNSPNEPNHSGRSMEYFGGVSPGMGPNIGLGLGPTRYMERDDWRGRLSHFPREFDRDRDFRRDVRPDIRDIREPRPPRDPRDLRDMRDISLRERDQRERDMLYPREPDYRDRDPRDRDLRELGITTRELRERDNREREIRERGIWSSDSKGRDSFSGREGPELDVRELVERERERERERDRDRDRDRERDRNRERPIWLHSLDKDHDGSIPTRPAAFDPSRERERDRDRPSSSRAMTMVQELDRDLLAYTADKPRQPHGNTEEPSNSDERIPTKPANFSDPSSHSQRDSKPQDDDDVKDQVRVNNRERRSRDEDTDETIQNHDQDKEQVQEREHVSHSKPDGAGLRFDASQFRNTTTGGRERIPSAPISDHLRPIKSLGTQPPENPVRKSYHSPPATSADPSSTSDVVKADAASDKLEDAVIKQEPPGVVDTPLAQAEEPTTLNPGDGGVSANGFVATLDSDEAKLAGGPTVVSFLSPGLPPVPEAADTSVPKEEEEEFENHADILVEIDKIDGKIQHFEDLLLKHRIQKEQAEAETTSIVDPVEDEDVPIDIGQAEAMLMVDETIMDVDEDVVLVTGKALPDDAKDADPVMDDEDDAASPVDLVPDRDTEDSRLDVIDSKDVDMNASDTEMDKNRRRQIIRQFSLQELQQPIDEDDPFYKRKSQQTQRPQLYDQIYAENNTRAQKYGRVHSATGLSRYTAHPHHHHRLDQDQPQIYASVEDYPCYLENIDNHNRLREVLLHNMAMKAAALDEKELELKREYKQYWETWTKKVEKLDKIKEKMSNAPLPTNVREEDLVQSDNVLFTTRNRRGTYNSDAVRSEAELLEIIQSLENADMRNPDLRASRTAATVPPMILDPIIREKVHYYDRNHLVTDPAKYYRLGPVTDTWTEEERQIYIKRYLNYPKQFGKIAAGLENKTACQCVLFYYREKKKIGFKDMLSNRGRKRKPAAGKRKEKAAQGSPSRQPGKKSKGSALIEDIGQANRKTAKSKEIRELQDMKQSWGDFDPEPGARRRVRSGAASQHGITSGIEDSNSNAASPAPSSAVSTPIISSVERRKQRTKGTTTRSSAASNAKALAEEVPVEEKRPKADKLSSAAASASTKATPKSEETFISVDSPTANPVATTNQIPAITAEQSPEIIIPTTATPTPSGGPARWTPAEHAKCIAALKKHGRDFEAVANAVGTKTVDQCKNYCFNYKRRFGVSALDDANSLDLSELGEEGEDKDGTGAGVEKNKARKGRSTNSISASAPGTPNSTTAGVAKDGPTTPSGRRRVKPIVQDNVKEDFAKLPSEKAISIEESESAGDKKRRKRVASKSEASGTPTEVIPTPATSFRALYSRDPPSESSLPSLPAPLQAEDAPSPGVVSVDGSSRRPNFSSYWSRQEKIDFVRLLSVHGKDWEKISKALKTKTAIQVRNHYSNNAEKLAADGVIGMERTVSPVPPSMDNGEQSPESISDQSHQQPYEGGYIDQDLADHVVEHGVTGQPAERAYHSPIGAGPKSGYFMPPSHIDDRTESSQLEEPRSVTPPRRITNIGNLLNNDDDDVNVAVEDWFGGNSEEGSNPSQEHSFEADGQLEQEPMRRQPQSYGNSQARIEDEDVETEDEYEPRRHPHAGINSSGSAGVMVPNQRSASEAGTSFGRHDYQSSVPSGGGYYSHSHQPSHSSQQHVAHAGHGVLGSPYGSQQYYSSSHANSGYRSPPPPMSPTASVHSLQRVRSPSVAMSSAPSAVMQPAHYSSSQIPPPHHHSQHQRSSSISHVEMVPRSNSSPQANARSRSPMSHQGPYFSHAQHHGYAPPPSHVPYAYPQHHSSRHPGHIEVLAPHPRPISEPSRILQHQHSSGSVAGHGHALGHAHSGSVSRYSSSPQLPGSGSMRGSPGPGGPSNVPGSPVHLGHGGGHMPSRYSPIPSSAVSSGSAMAGLVGQVTSPRMTEPPVHHAHQHQYQQHLRRSSSPFQQHHHIPGQVQSPSFLPPPGMHPASSSKHQSSSSFSYGPSTPTSLLPPPPAGYHPSHHHQQQASFGHPQHSGPYGTQPPHHNQPSSHHQRPQ